MSTKTRWIALLLILPVVFLITACGGDGDGDNDGGVVGGANLQLNLTDAPGDFLSVLVRICGIYAIVGESEPIPMEFADFTSPAIVDQDEQSVTVDLIQLADEEPIEFAFGKLPEGRLNQIRLIVCEASIYAFEDVVGFDGNDDGIIDHTGATFPVKVPSGAESGIKLNPRDIDISSRTLTALTLDFDSEKSIVTLGGSGEGREFNFILKPVIFIVEAIGTLPVGTETMATGLNFPTAVKTVSGVSEGSIILNDDILVANAGTTGTNSNSLLSVSGFEGTPIDTTALTPLLSGEDTMEGEPLVNSPTGLAQHLDFVWLSNAATAAALYNAGTVVALYTTGEVRSFIIGNEAPTESEEGLFETTGVEFGGFAPNGTLDGDDFVLFQTNRNGSLTALNQKDGLIMDLLEGGAFVHPADLAFVPSETPLSLGDEEGTLIGHLFVVDRDTNRVAIISLATIGGKVGEAATRIKAELLQNVELLFLSEPVGIAFSPCSNRLFIANRGNGAITAMNPDGTESLTFDTGFGASTLNGIDVQCTEAEELLFLSNTAGRETASDIGESDGTLERITVPIE
jgi:hypothetical protein